MKSITIITVFIICLSLFTNTIFARENIINLSENEKTYSPENDMEVFPDVMENLEIEGYDKQFDEATQMYNFSPEITNNTRNIENLTNYDLIATGSAVEIESYEQPIIRASYPDLRMDSVEANIQPFEALGDASFTVKISNIGAATANNVQIGVKINNTVVAKVSIGNMSAGYIFTGNLTLSGVPDGTHTLEFVADVDHLITESSESNNSITKSFKWAGTVDLTVSVDSRSQILLGNTYAETDYPLYFYITNSGNAAVNKTFLVRVYGNNKTIGTFSISKINGYSELNGSMYINFGANYGKNTIKITVDVENSIAESNESNNSLSFQRDVIYCTHYLSNPKRAKSKDLNVKVLPSASNYFDTDYFMNVGAWNGITSNVSVESLTFSNDESTEYDILIEGNPAADQDYYAATRRNNGVKSRITLNTNNVIGLVTLSDVKQNTVLIHEMGHIFGLEHPNTTNCLDYKSIMSPDTLAPNLASDEITMHDVYNIVDLYK